MTMETPMSLTTLNLNLIVFVLLISLISFVVVHLFGSLGKEKNTSQIWGIPKMVVPPVIIHFDEIFHINNPFRGTPISGNLHIVNECKCDWNDSKCGVCISLIFILNRIYPLLEEDQDILFKIPQEICIATKRGTQRIAKLVLTFPKNVYDTD